MLALLCWLHQHFLVLIQAQIFKPKKLGAFFPLGVFARFKDLPTQLATLATVSSYQWKISAWTFILAEILSCSLAMPSLG